VYPRGRLWPAAATDDAAAVGAGGGGRYVAVSDCPHITSESQFQPTRSSSASAGHDTSRDTRSACSPSSGVESPGTSRAVLVAVGAAWIHGLPSIPFQVVAARKASA
jgi:hypothetical protein